MEVGLVLIFWYGILHAFAPDHLAAIADFSIGKNERKTLFATSLFAIGHGLSLFLFAKILQHTGISEDILAYGDLISAMVIIGMGVYLLFMVLAHRIQLRKHTHEDGEHMHIWFGESHKHNAVQNNSSFSLGVLMGAGGARGMLVTLSTVKGGVVDLAVVGLFTLGVVLVFAVFGMLMLHVNQNFLGNLRDARRAFLAAGLVSLLVGTNILLG